MAQSCVVGALNSCLSSSFSFLFLLRCSSLVISRKHQPSLPSGLQFVFTFLGVCGYSDNCKNTFKNVFFRFLLNITISKKTLCNHSVSIGHKSGSLSSFISSEHILPFGTWNIQFFSVFILLPPPLEYKLHRVCFVYQDIFNTKNNCRAYSKYMGNIYWMCLGCIQYEAKQIVKWAINHCGRI